MTVAVFAGGMLGALARVAIAQACPVAPGRWPWATLAINVSGAFLLGVLATARQARPAPNPQLRGLTEIGFCGAYTTFSTVSVELLRMLDRNHLALAAGYAAFSVAAGLAALWLASAAVRRARSRRPAGNPRSDR